MTELALPARGGRRFKGAPGTEKQVGRNNPHIGLWLLEELIGDKLCYTVADPMCGAGQLWLNAIQQHIALIVYGCDIAADRVELARANRIQALVAWAQEWRPPECPDLVAFSPIYPNCDHDSGANQKQQDLIRQKGAHAMQRIEGTRNLLPVFLNIASWRGTAMNERTPVAVIARNAIENQIEVDWVSEIEASMNWAGLGPVERFRYPIPPGMTEQWKLARNPRHRVITHEWILVGGRGAK